MGVSLFIAEKIVAQSDVIIDFPGLKSTCCYRRMTAEKYEALLPINNDNALSLVKEYEALLPINIDKMPSSIDKYKASLPLNKNTASSPINS